MWQRGKARWRAEPGRGQRMQVLSLESIARMSRPEAEDAIRARVQTVYLGDNRLLTRILGGPKLFLSTQDLGFAGHVMMDGFWEMWLTQFFARIVKPGMTVIDVGANAGYYTVLFGDAVGRQGRVIAVEPVPATLSLLRQSVALNGHASYTRIADVALGKEPAGEVLMILPEGEPKNATVVPNERPGAFRVPSTNLDTLARDLDRVDLIKIDAEGAEEDIVAGMQELLARHRPNVLLEFNAARSRDASGFVAHLRQRFERMQQLDFQGVLQPISDRVLLDTTSGEDILLFLESRKQ